MNLLPNGDVSEWSAGGSFSLASAGAYTADHWWVGPQPGGNVQVTRVPRWGVGAGGPSALQIKWLTGYTWSPDPNDPTGGVTFIENHIGGQAQNWSDATLRYRFSAKVLEGPCIIVPVLWVNWKNGDYKIIAGPSVTLVSGLWRDVDWSPVVPSAYGHDIDSSNYVAIGVDFPVLEAPTISLRDFSLERG